MQLHHSQLVGFGIALKAPAADGDAGHVLKTDGAGTLSFGAEADAVAMAYLDQSVKVAASPTFAGATLTGPLQVTRTTEQMRIRYDAANFFNITVDSGGNAALKPTSGLTYFTTATKNNTQFLYDYTATNAWARFRGSDFALILNSVTTIALWSSATVSYINNGANFGIGTSSPSAQLHVVKTTEQLRVGYDASNYFSVTVGSTGTVTLDAVGAGAGFAFSDSCRFNGGTASSDGTAGATGSVATAKVGGGTRTLHFKNGLYTGYTDS